MKPKKLEMPSLMDLSLFSPPVDAGKKNLEGERPKISMVVRAVTDEAHAEPERKKKWHEVSEVPIDLTQLTEAETKRQDTIYELIETEEFYVHELDMIIEVSVRSEIIVKGKIDVCFCVGFQERNREAEAPQWPGGQQLVLQYRAACWRQPGAA